MTPPAATTESLDIEQPAQLVAYLRGSGRIPDDETPTIQVLAGGISNRTVLVTRATGESWVLKQALPKLRVEVDWFSDPRRIEREALGLKWLPILCGESCTPTLVFLDPTHHLLAMAAVPRPHENWKSMLLAGRLDDDHVRQFATLLGNIHQSSWHLRSDLKPRFADRSFFESLRVEPYYEYAASQFHDAAEFVHELIADTRSRRLCLVHGDYSPKNVLVRDGRLVLLDHEVIHWGEPAFDLGFALTHLLSKAHHLPTHRQRFAGAAVSFWNDYAATLEFDGPWIDLEPFAVRHTLACLLARVAGRSPLEYLKPDERRRQQAAVVALMHDPPKRIVDFVSSFIDQISHARN